MSLKSLFSSSICILCLEFVLAINNLNLTLKNDGPAILDSKIIFYASINDPDYPHDFVFKDNTGYSNETVLSGKQSMTYARRYESGKYQNGNYTMEVEVYRPYKNLVAHGNMKFELTVNMVGEIIAYQDDIKTDEYFSTNKLINFTASIYDPNHFFLNKQLTYLWLINNNKFINEADFISYNFTVPGNYKISVTIFAITYYSNASQNYFKDRFKIKWGHFMKDIIVKDPVSMINVTGNLWLKHGDLLVINVSCDGSGPSFEYCWEIVPFNETKNNFTCNEPIVTTTCSFIIQRYFPEVGSHFIKTFFSNYVSYKEKTIEIRIYDVSKQPQLSTVIIPIVCSVLTIVIIIMGIAYHIQQRKHYSVEVADFDFHQTEDLVEKTFFQRLRDSFKSATFRTKEKKEKENEEKDPGIANPLAN